MININVILLILLVLLFFYYFCNIEKFESNITSSEWSMNDNPKNNTFVPEEEIIREVIPIFHDPLFSDIKLYINDNKPYEEQISGLSKCLDNCSGKCVEFGITGNTFCFPKENK